MASFRIPPNHLQETPCPSKRSLSWATVGPDLRSEIAAGIAPVAWIVAWTVPAVRSATVHRGTVDIIRTMSARVTDSCPVPEDSGVRHGW